MKRSARLGGMRMSGGLWKGWKCSVMDVYYAGGLGMGLVMMGLSQNKTNEIRIVFRNSRY